MIKHFKIKQNFASNPYIQYAGVNLKRLDGQTATDTALYQKPNKGLSSNLDQLENLKVDEEILIRAELSAKYPALGGTTTNRKGKILYNWVLNSLNIDIIPTIRSTRVLIRNSELIPNDFLSNVG
ncbi:hypothetical protein GQX74_013718 [Glossina fuscipes]|nr:hypothetical protein GQX74_013718 [Glossina fuscipes]